MFAIDHGKRSGPLLAVVHDGVGLEVLERALQERVIGDVADVEADALAGQFLPARDALPDGSNRRQRVHAQGRVPMPAHQAIEDAHLEAAFR